MSCLLFCPFDFSFLLFIHLFWFYVYLFTGSFLFGFYNALNVFKKYLIEVIIYFTHLIQYTLKKYQVKQIKMLTQQIII